MSAERAKYTIGQVIHHRIYGYRGVIYDVDPVFHYTENWYNILTSTRPARNQPWYHVLIDHTELSTYVAEQNLDNDDDKAPIEHPDINKYFNNMEHGVYTSKRSQN